MDVAYPIPVLALGATGATLRYLLDGYVGARFPGSFPRGTFVINVSGSFLLGLLTGLVVFGGAPRELTDILGTGFCGAFTTFSTFTFESIRLIEEGAYRRAALYVVASLAAGLGAAAVGLVVASV